MNKQELKEKYNKPHVPHEWQKTDKLTTLVTTFFGSGMSPKAPGTIGSLVAAILAYPLATYAITNWDENEFLSFGDNHYFGGFSVNTIFLIAALFIFFAAIPFVKKAMKDTGTEDPGWIVIDEVCGVFMALAFTPCFIIVQAPWILAVAFGLFRFFDIFKPLGIHKMEKLPGAWGVMADDLLGGIYTAIIIGIGFSLAIYLSDAGSLLYLF